MPMAARRCHSHRRVRLYTKPSQPAAVAVARSSCRRLPECRSHRRKGANQTSVVPAA
ncbi:Os05g0417250 [Oryza sativa Japonica Group]|uniref:Os05g0417250 protein n=1 Tax=Oryza sativa subsp. japonica TaxID=39947 RepID=C7J315_ORYSJ|nr:Os05g0417250 [Oryza sativa Japonica Group]|eukprot:NP_001174423.1 Os05g0417250 [Oryza sativa Japonica Group]